MTREEYLAYQKAYREKNRDILRAKDRERYRCNKEYRKKYYEEHKEKLREYGREYGREYRREHYGYKKKHKEEPYSNNVFEVWSDINDDYCVSNYGRVWNKCTKRFIGHKNGMGYIEAVIDGKGYLVHRLVAKAFIPNPENLPEIDHIDTDRTNNVYTNLRWTDRKGNQNNPITLENFRKANKDRDMSVAIKAAIEAKNRKVDAYTLDGEYIKTFDSMKEAASYLCVDKHTISDCCRGKQKTAKGKYTIKYHTS